jgi:hypothetical protein
MLRQTSLTVILALVAVAAGQPIHPQQSSRRHDPTDLEIVKTDVSGAVSERIFLSRAFLASLHQVSAEVRPDGNDSDRPSPAVRATGIDLETLLSSVTHADRDTGIAALCADGYTSPFPRRAILQHHPILVLTMDGLSPHAWAVKHHAYDPSPYFIAYQDFIPSFHILSHQDWAQSPAEIVTIKILPSSELERAIRPKSANTFPQDSPVLEGFQIARQNCIRCHNAGATGGVKAQRTWQHLGEVARNKPDFFATWVHNPQSIDPYAIMPANLKYDQATLNALTRYFQTFAP